MAPTGWSAGWAGGAHGEPGHHRPRHGGAVTADRPGHHAPAGRSGRRPGRRAAALTEAGFAPRTSSRVGDWRGSRGWSGAVLAKLAQALLTRDLTPFPASPHQTG